MGFLAERCTGSWISGLILITSLSISSLNALVIQCSDELKCLESPLKEHSVSFPGSFPALEALKSGDADVAIVAYEDAAFKTHPFAYQASIVTIHPSNPLESITRDQLRAILGTVGDFKWRQLTEDPAYQERSILPYISKQNLGFHCFQARCLAKNTFNDHVNIFDNDQAILPKIIKNTDALALLAYKYPGLKVIKIEGASPEENNYPFRVNFNILYKNEAKEEVLTLIQKLESKEIQEILKKNNFFSSKS